MPYEAHIHCCNSLPQKLMLVGHREPYGGQVCVCVCVCWPVCGPLRGGDGRLGKVGGTTHLCCAPILAVSKVFATHSAPLGNHSSPQLHFTSSLIQESVTNTWGERRGRLNPIRLD